MSGGPSEEVKSRVTLIDADRTSEDGVPAITEVDHVVALPRISSIPPAPSDAVVPPDEAEGSREFYRMAERRSIRESREPLQKSFVSAAQERFGEAVQEVDDKSIFLIFSGYPIYVLHNGIEVCSHSNLGNSKSPDVLEQPEPEEIIEDLFLTINLRAALMPLGYEVIEKGLSPDGYYDYVMRKDVPFDSKDQVVSELDQLKEILKRVEAENSDE